LTALTHSNTNGAKLPAHLLSTVCATQRNWVQFGRVAHTLVKGPWTPKLTYTFYSFSWKCRIFW